MGKVQGVQMMPPRRVENIGAGFAVVPPKWTDEPERRASHAGLVSITTHDMGFTIRLDGVGLVDLNRADAQALGLALIRADR